MRIMNKIIMTLAGLLLIVAAILKFHELLTVCIPSWRTNPLGFWESYEFFLIQIPLEFALGVWMVSGLFRKAAWIAGTLAFFGFIFVTIFKIVTGAESCGCFGQIQVDPQITLFVMDIPIFLLLAIFRPKGTKLLPPPWPSTLYLLAVAIPTIGLMVLSAPAMVTFRLACVKVEDQPDKDIQIRLELRKLKQELAAKQQELQQLKLEVESLRQQLEALQKAETIPDIPDLIVTDSNEPQIQNPEIDPLVDQMPIVEQWDLLQYVVEDDVRNEMTQGMVVVFMHRYDCSTCAEIAPRYSDYCKEMTKQGNDDFKIVFLAITEDSDEDPIPKDTTCIKGNLTDEENWEVNSPLVVLLLDGEFMKNWPEGTAPEPENIFDELEP